MPLDLKTGKLSTSTLERLKNVATLNKIPMYQLVDKLVEPELQRLEKETYARFNKQAGEKTRSGQ